MLTVQDHSEPIHKPFETTTKDVYCSNDDVGQPKCNVDLRNILHLPGYPFTFTGATLHRGDLTSQAELMTKLRGRATMIHVGYGHSNRRVQHDRFPNGEANYTTVYREVTRDATIVTELTFAAFWESLDPSQPR